MTIGEVIYRIKRLVKGQPQDALLTDRFVYSLLQKHTKLLLRRKDAQNKILGVSSFFKWLPFEELIEVDKVGANRMGITSNCTIKRTKDKLPSIMEGYYGPLIKGVYSIDKEKQVIITSLSSLKSKMRLSTFKYDKNFYGWYSDGHLYFYNLDWVAVAIEGLFEDTEDCTTTAKQDMTYNIPDDIHSELESLVLKDIAFLANIPIDPNKEDANHILR